MKMEIKPRDRKLLAAACSAMIVVLMMRLAILPAVDACEAGKIQYQEKSAQAEKMQETLDSQSANEARIAEENAALEELSGSCYKAMENRQVDELVTGAALAHNLFPSQLLISEQTIGIPAPYLYSGGGASAGSQAEEMEEEDASEEDKEGAVRKVQASISMSGSEENMKAFLNDIEENYPAVLVKSFEMSENLYLDTQLQAVTEFQMNAVLEIYMYTTTEEQ